MAKIVTDSKKLVEDLKYLESQPSYYKAKYPYNLCLVNPPKSTESFKDCLGNKQTNYNPHYAVAVSGDCVNLYKALLNGYDVHNKTIGYYQADCSNVVGGGNCTEWGLLKQCSDISKDFSKLKNGEPRLLYMSGHIGGFIGEFTKYGKIYNVCECTTSWNGGILFSYVDGNGNRFKSKGGNARGKWTHNGLMTPWVKYVDTSSQDMDEISDVVVPVNDDKPKVQPTTHEGSSVAHYVDKKYARSYKVIARTSLNLRTGVGASTEVKTRIPYGSMVTCYGYYDLDATNTVWLYVSFGDMVGFCDSSYLQ